MDFCAFPLNETYYDAPEVIKRKCIVVLVILNSRSEVSDSLPRSSGEG